MDGHDPDPKPRLGIPTAADTIHPTEKDGRKTKERTTQCPRKETHPAPHQRSISKINTDTPYLLHNGWKRSRSKTMFRNSTTADTIHPLEKDRRKNDREDDTMPHERDTPCPAPEFNPKNQHRKPHTSCTMDGNDPDPKPCLDIPPQQTLYTPQ